MRSLFALMICGIVIYGKKRYSKLDGKNKFRILQTC